MTTTTGTNDLKQAHAALTDELRQLEEAISVGSREGLAQVRDRLAAVRTHVTDHFAFEEQSGYMGILRKREPRLERATEHLFQEHRQLTQSLDQIIRDTQVARFIDDGLRANVQKWIEHLTRHEFRENDLVQDAFNQDVAAED